MHQSTCNIPIYPFRLTTTIRFSKSNSIYRNYSSVLYFPISISNQLKYISNFLYQSRFHFGISNQNIWKYEFQNITMHTNKYATKYRAPPRQGKGHAPKQLDIYIYVHLPLWSRLHRRCTSHAWKHTPPISPILLVVRVTRIFSHTLNHFISQSGKNLFTT